MLVIQQLKIEIVEKQKFHLLKLILQVKTRKLELAEQEIQDSKRLEARKKLKKSEAEIEKTIYSR